MRALWLLWITVLTFPSNEGKSLRAEQPLSAFRDLGNEPRLQKRSPDYYYDYDYGLNYDLDLGLRDPPPPPSPTTTTQSPFPGFKIFLEGLKNLQDALDNPNYDWAKVEATVPDDSKAVLPPGNYSSDIHELLVLTKILKRLSQSKQPTTTTPSTRDILESVESLLNYISQALDEKTPPEERRQILYTLAPDGNEGSVQEAVAEVSELYSKLLGEASVSLPPPDMASLDGSAMLLNMTLRIMEEAQEEYERKMREDESHTESSINHIERLRSVIPGLHSISDGFVKQTTRRREHHTTRKPVTKKPSEDLCTLPFIDVAYKVCILPVLDRQLSWHDAHQYCRHRGLELAMDSGVIKGRKYFNNELGLSGTRERWTLWVGGKKDDQGRWLWNDGTTLPNFFWSKNQPRVYGQDSTPAGTCMAIHGFSEYYGTALPCHNRRRFVCQKI